MRLLARMLVLALCLLLLGPSLPAQSASAGGGGSTGGEITNKNRVTVASNRGSPSTPPPQGPGG